jgi:hypothetical protein
MSDDSSQEVKKPRTFADALQQYFATGNDELYEAKARVMPAKDDRVTGIR